METNNIESVESVENVENVENKGKRKKIVITTVLVTVAVIIMILYNIIKPAPINVLMVYNRTYSHSYGGVAGGLFKDTMEYELKDVVSQGSKIDAYDTIEIKNITKDYVEVTVESIDGRSTRKMNYNDEYPIGTGTLYFSKNLIKIIDTMLSNKITGSNSTTKEIDSNYYE